MGPANSTWQTAIDQRIVCRVVRLSIDCNAIHFAAATLWELYRQRDRAIGLRKLDAARSPPYTSYVHPNVQLHLVECATTTCRNIQIESNGHDRKSNIHSCLTKPTLAVAAAVAASLVAMWHLFDSRSKWRHSLSLSFRVYLH